MKIQYKNTVYVIPTPESKESEVVIKVDKQALIPIPEKMKTNLRNIQNPYAKFFFFLLHEGIGLTLNKVRTSILQKKIKSERHVVFVYGQIKSTNDFAIGLGPQDCPLSEYLIFPKNLIVNVEKQRDIQNDYKIISEYFKHNPEKLEELYHYSNHSEKTLSFILENILKEEINHPNNTTQAKYSFQTFDITKKEISHKQKEISNKREYDLFLAGFGTYARSYILPNLKNVNHHTIIDYNPLLASVIVE